MSGAIGEPSLRKALPLAPMTLAVELSKPREFSYSRPNCNRFNLRDRAEQREVHGAMVPKLRGAVNGKDRDSTKAELAFQFFRNVLFLRITERPNLIALHSLAEQVSQVLILIQRTGLTEIS
jgi:hypothetical protein